MPTKATTGGAPVIAVTLETTPKKTFACALEWPGWCRSGRDPDAALAALADYAQRYGPVASAAGFPLPATTTLAEVERLPGGATTAFGAPEVTFEADRAPVTPAAATRMAALVRAAWSCFDEVLAVTPESLRKGPRPRLRDRTPGEQDPRSWSSIAPMGAVELPHRGSPDIIVNEVDATRYQSILCSGRSTMRGVRGSVLSMTRVARRRGSQVAR